MIDGIIQNVFEKFKQEYFFSPSILTCIEKHEQELIADIKKEFNLDGNIIHFDQVKQILIGDNQEDNDKLSEDDFEE